MIVIFQKKNAVENFSLRYTTAQFVHKQFQCIRIGTVQPVDKVRGLRLGFCHKKCNKVNKINT